MNLKKVLLVGLIVALGTCMVGCGDKENNIGGENNNNQGQVVNTGTATGDVSGDIISLVDDEEVFVSFPMQDYITAETSETYVGLTSEEFTANIEEGVFYESMMMPANQSYCLLKVKDGVNTEDIMQKVFAKANPVKWICMSADRVLVMGDDSYVFLAMGPVETCDLLEEKFKALAGDDVKESLDKVLTEENMGGEGEVPGGMIEDMQAIPDDVTGDLEVSGDEETEVAATPAE